MTTVISCGVIVLNIRQELFVCHATGTARWDLPKGVADPGESPVEAAVREAWEETGLRLDQIVLDDLRVFDYLPGKQLHLFALRVAVDAFDITACRCRSTFPHRVTGQPTPEADGYAWKPLARLGNWCGKNLSGPSSCGLGSDRAVADRLEGGCGHHTGRLLIGEGVCQAPRQLFVCADCTIGPPTVRHLSTQPRGSAVKFDPVRGARGQGAVPLAKGEVIHDIPRPVVVPAVLRAHPPVVPGLGARLAINEFGRAVSFDRCGAFSERVVRKFKPGCECLGSKLFNTCNVRVLHARPPPFATHQGPTR